MSMKIDTTVCLSDDVVAALDARAHDPEERSELVEAALRAYLLHCRARDASRDLEIINARSAELNEEAQDVLSYQIIL
jgi:metal-responsive CopG/Arc/MetJ family transcriptional regulator